MNNSLTKHWKQRLTLQRPDSELATIYQAPNIDPLSGGVKKTVV